MLERLPAPLLRSKLTGPAAFVPTAIRIGAGGFVALAGVAKFTERATEVHDFREFGVPAPELAVPLAGTIEVVGGLLVLIGLLTRPAALAVAANLLGALLTAGVNVGGTFHLVVGPTVMVAMLFLVWSGGGELGLDDRILTRRAQQGPEPQTNST
jgi:putative oxidoreductase